MPVNVRPHTARALLLSLGMGNFNITGVIPHLFQPVAATDSCSPDLMLLVEALQNNLNAMGAGLAVTGQIDVATAYCLRQITGKEWPVMHWHEIVTAVVNARERGFVFKKRPAEVARGQPVDVSGFEMPGGIWGWGAAIGVALLIVKGRNKRSA